MSFEAINSITGAESEARAAVAAAEQRAKQMLSDADNAGRAAVEAAAAKAEAELAELRRQADERALKKAAELSAETDTLKSALRFKAEGRLGEAAKLIVERIVNS